MQPGVRPDDRQVHAVAVQAQAHGSPEGHADLAGSSPERDSSSSSSDKHVQQQQEQHLQQLSGQQLQLVKQLLSPGVQHFLQEDALGQQAGLLRPCLEQEILDQQMQWQHELLQQPAAVAEAGTGAGAVEQHTPFMQQQWQGTASLGNHSSQPVHSKPGYSSDNHSSRPGGVPARGGPETFAAARAAARADSGVSSPGSTWPSQQPAAAGVAQLSRSAVSPDVTQLLQQQQCPPQQQQQMHQQGSPHSSSYSASAAHTMCWDAQQAPPAQAHDPPALSLLPPHPGSAVPYDACMSLAPDLMDIGGDLADLDADIMDAELADHMLDQAIQQGLAKEMASYASQEQLVRLCIKLQVGWTRQQGHGCGCVPSYLQCVGAQAAGAKMYHAIHVIGSPHCPVTLKPVLSVASCRLLLRWPCYL